MKKQMIILHFANNHFYSFLRHFDIYQIFFSAQVKRCASITYNCGIYQLPHELQDDLRLNILGN